MILQGNEFLLAIYLPIMYYPLSKENRNTGFLMPSYGSSTYKGQTISNAFFWAINRSQDATFLHDWFSKTGQAVAGEYRYVSLGGAGNVRTDFLNEHPITFVGTDGKEIEQEGRRTFRTYGNLSQNLGGSWYAQGRADYSTDLTVDRLYDADIARATRRTRSYGGSVSGTSKGIRVTGTYDRSEYFAENARVGDLPGEQRVAAGFGNPRRGGCGHHGHQSRAGDHARRA